MWMKFPFVFSGGKVEKKENRLAARHVDLIGKKKNKFQRGSARRQISQRYGDKGAVWV